MSRVSAHPPLSATMPVRLMATITQVTVSLIPGYNHHFLPVWDRFGGQIPWLSPSAAVPGRLMTTITQVTASLIPGYKHHFLSVWDGFWGQLPWLSPSTAVSVRSMTTIKAITQVTVSLIPGYNQSTSSQCGIDSEDNYSGCLPAQQCQSDWWQPLPRWLPAWYQVTTTTYSQCGMDSEENYHGN